MSYQGQCWHILEQRLNEFPSVHLNDCTFDHCNTLDHPNVAGRTSDQWKSNQNQQRCLFAPWSWDNNSYKRTKWTKQIDMLDKAEISCLLFLDGWILRGAEFYICRFAFLVAHFEMEKTLNDIRAHTRSLQNYTIMAICCILYTAHANRAFGVALYI